MKKLFLLLLPLFFWVEGHAQNQSSATVDSILKNSVYVDKIVQTAPPVAALWWFSALSSLNFDQEVYNFRHVNFPKSNGIHWEDYLQYSPYALQFYLGLTSLERRSSSWNNLILADAVGAAFAATVALSTKYIVGRERPDRSAHNSFPSGHTTTAVLGAELLSIEYADRYPALSALSYAMAGATGMGRIIHNRHWASDVLAGAGLGFLSAHLGYYVSDFVFNKGNASLFAPIDPSRDITAKLLYSTSRSSFNSNFSRSMMGSVKMNAVLLFPFLTKPERKWSYAIGPTIGIIGDTMDKDNEYNASSRDRFVHYGGGIQTEAFYRLAPRLSLGASLETAGYFSPTMIAANMGLSAVLEYDVDNHRSIRFFCGEDWLCGTLYGYLVSVTKTEIGGSIVFAF